MDVLYPCAPNLIPPSPSVTGLLSYLEYGNASLKVSALKKIAAVIDTHWPEVCDSLPLIEEMCEDTSFPAAELASYVASKCFYHLQEYSDALRLALGAGSYFDVAKKDEYVDTLLTTCIDEYKRQRVQRSSDETVAIDPRMESIIEKMFVRCYDDRCFEQAVGIALDTLRIDKVEEVVSQALAGGQEDILSYTVGLCQGTRNIVSREFRLAVVEVLVRAYATLPHPDFSNVCFGLQHLNRPRDVASVLNSLCLGSVDEALQAYQIAFDLQESENQGFVLSVVKELPSISGGSSSDAISSEHKDRMTKLRQILLEGFDVDLTLNFLFENTKTDMSILRNIKAATEGKTAILHNATVVAHGFMNCGTTLDTFLRENLDWLGKASNWAKFTAVASIGVVHKGHVHESLTLLQPYLPQAGQSGSPFSESGALCALGLIHANKGGAGDSVTISYLVDALRNAGNNETVQHGACLGIGLAAMATGNPDLFESLRQVLFTDSAVAGEGAALGMGLLMLGQCDSELAAQELPNLLNAAHDNQHEKVVRALALAIAMMVYGKEESADVIIEQLSRDRDAIIRYGAMFAVAMAYCGTGDNSAIRKLLHVAVSDVSDDVRRAAVSCIGLVCFQAPETVPKLVSLLAESFNAHVRYGAAMAIGIACAGLANKEAIDLLNPLLEDQSDFVRQGALIAMSMVLQQVSEARSPSVKKFRDTLNAVISDKHQTAMTKEGAILAFGILEAGGRNVAVCLHSRAGFVKMGSSVGMMMFLQYWYWYPLMNFLSLSFSPTFLIGLNKDFDMPTSFSVVCQAPPSMFAYPKEEEKKGDEKKLVTTAVLSTTAKHRAREARKEARKQGLPASEGVALERVASHMSTTSYLSVEERVEEVKPKKEKESSWFLVKNPSRVTASQVRFLSLVPAEGLAETLQFTSPRTPRSPSSRVAAPSAPPCRYVPVDANRRLRPSGIVMLKDEDPSQPEAVVKVRRVALGEGIEAEPPEPFEWNPNDE